MKEFFKKDWVLMIISLLVSIALWIYVSYNENPECEKTVKNIPIAFTNVSNDFEKGKLQITNDNASTVDIIIKGDRKNIAKINNENVTVSVDLINVTKPGNYSLAFNISFVTDGVEIIVCEPNRYDITVDEVITAEKEIIPEIKGTAESGYAVENISVSPEKIKLTGVRSEIDKIAKVIVSADISKVTSDTRLTERIYLYDGNEKMIISDRISKNIDVADIIVSMTNSKTVKIEPVIINTNLRPEYEFLPDMEGNDEIEITGTKERLDNISCIFTEPIDALNIEDGQSVNVKLVIPEGVNSPDKDKEITVKYSVTLKQN